MKHMFIQVFSTLSSELGIARVEPRLAAAVNKNIVKTVQLFCVKCEQSVKADADASQVVSLSVISCGIITTVSVVR